MTKNPSRDGRGGLEKLKKMTKIRPGWQIFKPKCVAFPFRGHAHIATAHREPLPPFPSKDLARTLFCTLYALQYNLRGLIE
jgi:hypothetical protein